MSCCNKSEESCIGCSAEKLLNKKHYLWHVTPRIKDEFYITYWDILNIYLCDDCIYFLDKNNVRMVYGWDRWDAIDNLVCEIPDKTQ